MKITVFLGGKCDVTPHEVLDIPWENLEAFLRSRAKVGPRESSGYIVAAEVEKHRNNANTGPATMLVVDYEPKGPANWDSWPCSYIAHTSSSHLQYVKDKNEDAGERWRVFLRLDSEIPAVEYKRAKEAVEAMLPGPKADVRARSQPAFLPTRADVKYRSDDTRGPLNWREHLPELVSGRPLVVGGDRTVGEAPDPALVERLIEQWVSVWPDTNRHDTSFALGGLLARGSWPSDDCLAFAEQILLRTDSNVEDGLECVELSLDRAQDGGEDEGIYGFNFLVPVLKLPPGASTEMRGVLLKSFLESFVAAMAPPPPPAPALPAPGLPGPSAAPSGPDQRDEDFLTWSGLVKISPKTGRKLANSFNAELTFEVHPVWKGVFAWDEFASKVSVLRDGPAGSGIFAGDYWTSDNGGAFAVQAWFSSRDFDEFQKGMIIDAIHREARKNSYHPVRQYLEDLPEWDGVDRNLSAYLGAEQTDYHSSVCGAWLRSAVARVLRPGCQADSLLVLEGRQGARKSTALRVLCPDTRNFLVVRSDVRSKDFLSNMRGKWLAELAEVDKLINSRDASELKDILSTTIDTYRKAYGHDDLSYPRQLVFAGTTNETDYLRDGTGNRRYWVVACGNLIDTDALARDRDQLWAQAYTEYLLGTPWWLDAAQEHVAAEEAAERLESDEWETFIENARSELNALGGFSTVDALGKLPGAIPVAQLDVRQTRRMAKVLRKMGFEYLYKRGPTGRHKLWFPRGGSCGSSLDPVFLPTQGPG